MDKKQARYNLSRLCKEKRERLGLSQREFATEIDVSPNAVHHWECRTSFPGHENLKKLAEYLGYEDVYDLEREIWEDIEYLPDQGKRVDADEAINMLDRVSDMELATIVLQYISQRLRKISSGGLDNSSSNEQPAG